MPQTRRRKAGLPEKEQTQADLSAEEFEDLRLQIKLLQQQVNTLSLASAQLGPRSFAGLLTLGTILYFLFLPFRWAKRAIALIRQVWVYLKQPLSYWTVFYWLCFAWVLILEGGLKAVLIFLQLPRRLAKIIGSPQQ